MRIEKASIRIRFKISCMLLTTSWFIVAGCMATGPKYTDKAPENSANAVVFIYRPKIPDNIFFPVNSYQYVIAPTIYHDDRVVTKLSVNAYTYIEVEPGPTSIAIAQTVFGAESSKVDVGFDARAGQTYYLRYETQMSEETPAILKIMPVELARKEIQKTRYKRASEQ